MNEDQLPDLLSGFKAKEDGFKTPPADYFSGLAAKIIADEEKTPTTTKSNGARIRQLLPAILSIAAALLLLVFFQPWADKSNIENTTTTELAVTESQLDEALASLTDEDIYEYISENITDFELETLTDE